MAMSGNLGSYWKKIKIELNCKCYIEWLTHKAVNRYNRYVWNCRWLMMMGGWAADTFLGLPSKKKYLFHCMW